MSVTEETMNDTITIDEEDEVKISTLEATKMKPEDENPEIVNDTSNDNKVSPVIQ